MNNRKETERAKYVQEKCQNLLTDMLRDEDNKYCVDCDAKGPRWASFNLGVFLCIRCAGIHRNLGVHISRVKSVNLDSWTPDQVVSLQQMGNSRARAVYEAQLPDGFRRPQTDSALESFVRAKYEHKKYMAREWVQPPPPKANWDKEIDDEMERQKRKKKTGGAAAAASGLSTNLGGLTGNSSLATKNDKNKISAATATAKVSIPAPLPKPKGHAGGSPKTSNRINHQQTTNKQTIDLLGLDTIVSTTPLGVTNAQIITTSTVAATNSHSNDDVFSNFLSAPVPPPSSSSSAIQNLTNPSGTNDGTTINNNNNNGTVLSNEMALAKEEQDFFNQIPTENDKIKMTKDSIMALYDTMPQSTPGQLINNNNNHNNINLGQFNPSHFNGSTAAMQFLPPQQLQQQQPHHQQPFLNQNQFNGFSTNFPTNFPVVAAGMMPLTGQQFNVQSLTTTTTTTTTINAGGGLPTASGSLFSTIPIQHIPNTNNNNIVNNSMGIHPSQATIPGNTNSNINQQFGNLNLGNVWQ